MAARSVEATTDSRGNTKDQGLQEHAARQSLKSQDDRQLAFHSVPCERAATLHRWHKCRRKCWIVWQAGRSSRLLKHPAHVACDAFLDGEEAFGIPRLAQPAQVGLCEALVFATQGVGEFDVFQQPFLLHVM